MPRTQNLPIKCQKTLGSFYASDVYSLNALDTNVPTCKFSWTSRAQTPRAHLPLLIRTPSIKHAYIDPLKPHLYLVKLGFTGVYIILISAQNINCGYSLEPPRWGGSNEYPQSIFWAELWKISNILSENFHFLVVKISIYLNRLVNGSWVRRKLSWWPKKANIYG